MSMVSSRGLVRATLLAALVTACSHGGGSTETPAPEQSKAGQTVTSKDIANTSGESVEKSLEGRFPGVTVLRTSEGGLSIRIRGAASFTGPNAPLYVIDGQPVEPGPNGDLTGLNPSDIE